MNTYNGWTNRQTWNISMIYKEIFDTMCEDQTFDDVEHLADSFESIVDELEFNDVREGSLAHQALGEYLNAVDWEEIAQHHAEDNDLFTEESEDENNNEESHDHRKLPIIVT